MMVTGVETNWRLCFLVEYLAFELGQAFPGHLSHPELAAAAVPAEFQLWAWQEGAPSWRHHLGAAAAAPGTPELCRTMGNPPGL